LIERNFFKLGLLASLTIHFFLIIFFPGFKTIISQLPPEYIEVSLITVSPPQPKIVKKTSLPPAVQVEKKTISKIPPVRIAARPTEKTPILTPRLKSESEMKIPLPTAEIKPILEKPQEPFFSQRKEQVVAKPTQKFFSTTHLPPKSIHSTKGVVSYQRELGEEGKGTSSSRIIGEVATRGISRSPEPSYPEWAEKQGIEADVELKFWVLPSGEVPSIEVFQTSGWSRLDRLSSEALSQWKFEPIERDVTQWGIIKFVFQPK